MFKKMFSVICIVMIGSLLFPAAKKISIGNNRSDLIPTIWKQIGDKFEAKTGIKVEVENWLSNDTIRTRYAGGKMPDIFMFSNDTFTADEWVKIFVPLNDLTFIKDLKPGVTDGFSYKGNIYGIGQSASYDGIVYNKTVLKNLGINEPKNMDEFWKMLDKIKAAGKIPYTFIPSAGWTTQSYIEFVYCYSLASGGSGNPQNDMVKMDAPFSKDKPFGKAAYTVFRLAKNYQGDDPNSLTWDACKIEIAKGNIAMATFGSWFPPQVEENGAKPGEIGLMPIPITDPKGQIFAGIGFDWHFGVYKDSPNVKEAKEFLNFMFGNKEIYALWMNNFGKTSILKSVDDTAAFLKDYNKNKPKLIILPPDTIEIQKLREKAEWAQDKFGQEIIAADSEAEIQKICDDWNKRWAKARKDLGYK
jgi:raffinose/stachyose/melibiose transport system substrate-binding protein